MTVHTVSTPVGTLIGLVPAPSSDFVPSPNRPPIVHPEQRAALPLRDADAVMLTHRGGVVSARAELY